MSSHSTHSLFRACLRLKVEIKSVLLGGRTVSLGTAGCGGEVRTWVDRAAAGWMAAAGSLMAVGAEPCTAVWGCGGLRGRARRATEQAGRARRA